MAHTMWVEIFPYTWASLSQDEQQSLAKPLGMLIARDCNKYQDLRRPNVVQVLDPAYLKPGPLNYYYPQTLELLKPPYS